MEKKIVTTSHLLCDLEFMTKLASNKTVHSEPAISSVFISGGRYIIVPASSLQEEGRKKEKAKKGGIFVTIILRPT